MATQVFERGSDYVGKKVKTTKEGKAVGNVEDVVVSSKEKKLIGLLLASGKPKKASTVLYKNVNEIVNNTIFIKSEDDVKKTEQIIDIPKKKGDGKKKFSQSPVMTESCKKIGMVTDFYFDPKSGKIKNLEYYDMSKKTKQRIDISDVKKLASESVTIKSRKAKKDTKDTKKDKKKNGKGLGKKLKSTAKEVKKEVKQTVKQAKKAVT